MSGEMTFLQALGRGEVQAVVGMLAENPNLARGKDAQGVSLLMQALYHRQGDVVEAILELRGGEVNLHEAAALGLREQLADLLDASSGASDLPAMVDRLAPDGFAPLHLACFFGREETVALLLARGASVELRADNPTAVRPLHSAVAGGNPAVVERLLAAGADPNSKQQAGFTPLMGAAAAGNADMVRALLAAGADPAAEADDGRTAADLARERGHGDLAAELGAEPEER